MCYVCLSVTSEGLVLAKICSHLTPFPPSYAAPFTRTGIRSWTMQTNIKRTWMIPKMY